MDGAIVSPVGAPLAFAFGGGDRVPSAGDLRRACLAHEPPQRDPHTPLHEDVCHDPLVLAAEAADAEAVSFLECLERCALASLGIETVVGVGGVVAGAPLIRKPRLGGALGSGYRTSWLSLRLGRGMNLRLPRNVWTPRLGQPHRRSAMVGRVIARWIPGVGWGLLALDAAQIATCVRRCTNEGGEASRGPRP